jgi:hypothetical protein
VDSSDRNGDEQKNKQQKAKKNQNLWEEMATNFAPRPREGQSVKVASSSSLNA